jgi:rubrerythrin
MSEHITSADIAEAEKLYREERLSLREEFIKSLKRKHQCPKCGHMWEEIEVRR